MDREKLWLVARRHGHVPRSFGQCGKQGWSNEFGACCTTVATMKLAMHLCITPPYMSPLVGSRWLDGWMFLASATLWPWPKAVHKVWAACKWSPTAKGKLLNMLGKGPN